MLKWCWSLIIGLVVVLFVGCSESTTGPDDNKNIDVTESQRLVASADSVIAEMIQSGATEQGYKSVIGYIQEVEDLYSQAAALDPSNSKASFGAAIFGFQEMMDNPDLDMITDTLESWEQDMENLDPAKYYITQYFMYGTEWFYIDEGNGYYWNYWIDPFDAFKALMYFVQNSFSDQNAVSMLQNMIDTTVLSKLNKSISYMDKVIDDQDFLYSVTSEMTGEDDSYEIDLGEAYMISAVMHMMRASLKIMNAYQLSVPGATSITDYTDLTTLLPLIKNQDETDGSFLTLRSTSLLPSAKADLISALTMVELGCQFITNETDSQFDDLIKKEDLTEIDSDINEDFTLDQYDIPIPLLRNANGILSLAGKIKTMLNGPFDVEIETDEGTETISISLNAFLSNAMPDLKAKLPYHSWKNLNKIDTGFYGPGIEQWGNRTFEELTYKYIWFDLPWIYEDIIGVDVVQNYYEYLGNVSEEGVVTINKAYDWLQSSYQDSYIDLSPGSLLTTDGAIYLDNQNRVCITQAAYNTINSYALNAPRDSWIAFEQLDYASSLASKNYSPEHPFGVRNQNGVFYFAGTPEYINFSSPVYFTDGPSGNIIDIDQYAPVFPDPTFGGILPGMTQQRFEELSGYE